MRIVHNHTCLAVHDLRQCRQFYQQLFGARLLKVAVEDRVEFYALPGGLVLELFEKLSEQSQAQGHLAFQVEDAKAFYQSMQQQGVPCNEPMLRPSGNTIVILSDPSGNEIEVLEYADGMDPKQWMANNE